MADRHDLRMPLLGVVAWAAALGVYAGGPAPWVLLVALGLISARTRAPLVGAALVVALAVCGGAALRHRAASTSPLAGLAARHVSADLEATVVSDPRIIHGRWGDTAIVRIRVHRVAVGGSTYTMGAGAVVFGDPDWIGVGWGDVIRLHGHLAPADDPDTSAIVTGPDPPVRLRSPDPWWRGAAAVRHGIRDAVAGRPDQQAALVAGLVDGDDAGLTPITQSDFRTTGLTHLTAVSGTNLTLIVGFLLALARWVGVKGRWLHVVGVLGIAGFVLLARTEPSVLRAAAMGTVGLFALGSDGRRRGLRALGVAVVALMLVQPGLAVSAGFALSALATAGIVLLGPPFTRALGRWLPRSAAEAVAIPLAAQLACTPVIAALSGQVSVVAVAANLLAAPVVGPATVLGLLGGLVDLVWPWAGRLVALPAAWCAAWLLGVAGHGAALPGAAIGWTATAVSLVVLTVLCIAAALLLPALLRRRRWALAATALVAAFLLGVPGRIWSLPGSWPPGGWLMVACDVGQGDALAVSVGPHAAIVVDTGPDPTIEDRCLDRLGVRQVPLLVLTHFHADHVDGLSGALSGRHVGEIETTEVLDPPEGVRVVQEAAARAGVPVRAAPYGLTRRYGDVTVQVLYPDLTHPEPGAGDGSSANNSSVVLLVESHGLRLLLTGDVEPPGQAQLAQAYPGLHVDVLKVPHHGSRYQDPDWLTSLRARVAIISVGKDNDYGHPAQSTLDVLQRAGLDVARTDQDGGVAVVERDGGPQLVTEN
ncbi:ComEC/Rec2 family competence protein [Nocardioides ultimimeridianus]